MAIPFRLLVQQKLSEALEEIATQPPSLGYHHDLAGRVFRGRLVFSATDPLPAVSILEEPIPAVSTMEPSGGDGGYSSYDLMVQGFVADDLANPTDPAHLLMADVKRRLAQLKREGETDRHDRGVFLLGPKAPMVMEMRFGAGIVRPPDELSARAFFWLQVNLTLVEDHDEPFV